MKMGWGERLRRIRGKTPRDAFAASVGSNRSSWADYEGEVRSPNLETLIRLREKYQISIDWIAIGERPRAGIETDVLEAVIEAVIIEHSDESKKVQAKLVSALYRDRIKVIEEERNYLIKKDGKYSAL